LESSSISRLLNSYDKLSYGSFVELLTDYKMGSSFTFILFKNEKKIEYLKTLSSNSLTREKVDSFMKKTNLLLLDNRQKGYYVVPVIQVTIGDEKDMNWNNNSSWNFLDFEKEKLFSSELYMLKPIIIYTSKPHIN